MTADLRREDGLIVAEKAPYRIDDEDWTIPVHADARDLPGVLIEIRHDELASPAGVAIWAGRLARALIAGWRATEAPDS
jgi:predicted N-formylglutamate amidohydrolase